MENDGGLNQLSSLLFEFYCGSPSVERRNDIENALNNFKLQEFSWKSAVQFLHSSADQYVQLYSLSVLEHTVKKNKDILPVNEKLYLRNFLQEFVFASHSHEVETFLKAKALQILICSVLPDFQTLCSYVLERSLNAFTSPMESSVKAKCERFSTAMVCLKTVSEEIFNPKSLLGGSNQVENHIPIGQFSSSLVQSLLFVADNVLNPEIITEGTSMLSAATISREKFDVNFGNIVFIAAKFLYDLSCDASEMEAVLRCCMHLVECLEEQFSWLPLEYIDSRIYGLLCIFVLLGSPVVLLNVSEAFKKVGFLVKASLTTLSKLSLRAMSCLRELSDRKGMIMDKLKPHLRNVFQVVHLFLIIMSENSYSSDIFLNVVMALVNPSATITQPRPFTELSELTSLASQFEELSEEAYQQCADLLCLLMASFVYIFQDTTAFESSTASDSHSFSEQHFLSLVHRFTFSEAKQHLPVYFTCLDAWHSYIEFNETAYGPDYSLAPQWHARPAFAILCETSKDLLANLFYADSASHLDTMEDNLTQSFDSSEFSLDAFLTFSFGGLTVRGSYTRVSCKNSSDSEESEYREFVDRTLALLSEISTFLPTEIISSVLTRFQHGLISFSNLFLDNRNGSTVTGDVILREHTSSKVHRSLRDFATSIQCLGYMCDKIRTLKDVKVLHWLLQSLLSILHTTPLPTGMRSGTAQELLLTDIAEVLSQCLCLIGSFLVNNLVAYNPNVNKEADSEASSQLLLSDQDKSDFVSSLLVIIYRYVVDISGHRNITALRCVQYQAAHLFLNLFSVSAPPGFFPSHLFYVSMNEENSPVQLFQKLVNFCEKPDILLKLPTPTICQLLRALITYFLADERSASVGLQHTTSSADVEVVVSIKSAMFVGFMDGLFLSHLKENTAAVDSRRHLLILCLLAESVAAVDRLGSASRRHMYDYLTTTGIVNNLFSGLKQTLGLLATSESLSLKATGIEHCIAYLAFLLNFTQSFGHFSNAINFIPPLIKDILLGLQVPMQTTTIFAGSSILAGVIELLQLLVKNRRLLSCIVGDIINVCVYCILPALVPSQLRAPASDAQSVRSLVQSASRTDPELFCSLVSLLFSIISFGFSHFFQMDKPLGLSIGSYSIPKQCTLGHLADFRLLMGIILAIFCDTQPDYRLLTLCVDNLQVLQQRHRLFDLSAFRDLWRNDLAHSCLRVLSHKCCSFLADNIVECIFKLFTITVSSDNTSEHCVLDYKAFCDFLRLHVSSLQQLSDTQKSQLLTSFTQLTSSQERIGTGLVQCPTSYSHIDHALFSKGVLNFVSESVLS